MRTIVTVIYILIIFILSVPEWLIMLVVGAISPKAKADFAQWVARIIAKQLLFLAGVKLTVKGQENISQDEPALYAFNHRSFFDIVVGYATGPRPMAYVAKQSLMKVPVLSRLMRSLHCLPLDREDKRQGMKVILQGIEMLKQDYSIFIAPEGTRNHEEELLPFHEASFKLAEKSHRRIVPVALTHTDDIFEKHLPWLHSTRVTVEYLEPISMEELEKTERKHVGARVRTLIAEAIRRNEAEES